MGLAWRLRHCETSANVKTEPRLLDHIGCPTVLQEEGMQQEAATAKKGKLVYITNESDPESGARCELVCLPAGLSGALSSVSARRAISC